MQAVDLGGEQRISAVHGQGVLRQVVAADGEEVGLGGDQIGGDRSGRRLHHDPHLRHRAPEFGGEFGHHGPHRPQLRKAGDHRRHDLGRGLHPQDRPQLGAQQLRPREANANPAQAQRRVLFMRQRQIGHRLVAAYVQGADDQRPAIQRLGDRLVGGQLLGLVRRGGAVEEQEFGAQQAAALGAGLDRGQGLAGGAQVGEDLDPRSVRHSAGILRGGLGGGAAGAAFGQAALGGLQFRWPRRDTQAASIAVEDQQRPVLDRQQPRPESDDGGNVHCRGDDRHVRGRAALAERHAGDPRRVEGHQLRGQDVVGDQDGIVGQDDGRQGLAGQFQQHLPLQVGQVGGPLQHPPVAERLQLFHIAADGAPPGDPGAGAAGDGGEGRGQQFRILDEGEVGLGDRAALGRTARSPRRQRRACRRQRLGQGGALGLD